MLKSADGLSLNYKEAIIQSIGPIRSAFVERMGLLCGISAGIGGPFSTLSGSARHAADIGVGDKGTVAE